MAMASLFLVEPDDRWDALVMAVEAMAGCAHRGELGALIIVRRRS